MFRRPSPFRAFTLVEILVVIAVIGTLTAILLPALSGARARGRKLDESNRLRQVGVAWSLYATQYEDAAVPGLMDFGQQDRWRTSYDFPDGNEIPENEARYWPWRLMPFIDFDLQTVIGHMNLDDYSNASLEAVGGDYYDIIDDDRNTDDTSDDVSRPVTVARHPGFGYNAYYVGGVWECENGFCAPEYRSVNALDSGGAVIGPRNVLALSTAVVKSPAQLILFTTTADRGLGEHFGAEDTELGSWLAAPPIVADERIWQRFGGGSSADTIIEVLELFGGDDGTPIPVGRYTGQAAVLSADLHLESAAPGTLDDQRRWANGADRRDFMHTP